MLHKSRRPLSIGSVCSNLGLGGPLPMAPFAFSMGKLNKHSENALKCQSFKGCFLFLNMNYDSRTIPLQLSLGKLNQSLNFGFLQQFSIILLMLRCPNYSFQIILSDHYSRPFTNEGHAFLRSKSQLISRQIILQTSHL